MDVHCYTTPWINFHCYQENSCCCRNKCLQVESGVDGPDVRVQEHEDARPTSTVVTVHQAGSYSRYIVLTMKSTRWGPALEYMVFTIHCTKQGPALEYMVLTI